MRVDRQTGLWIEEPWPEPSEEGARRQVVPPVAALYKNSIQIYPRGIEDSSGDQAW